MTYSFEQTPQALSVHGNESPEELSAPSIPQNKRWGFWATLGFSLLIVGAFLLAQGVAGAIMTGIELADNPELEKDAYLKNLMGDGFFISLATIVSAWIGILTLGTFVLLRKGISLQEYLGIRDQPVKAYAGWLGITFLFLVFWGVLGTLMEAPEAEWMQETYHSAGNLPLLWVAIVIAAPLMEELFFRGFLFEGLRDSRVGSVGAVAITSVIWGAIHLQYAMFQMVMIGLMGVLLGIAKIKTQSVNITIAMHAFLNLIAMLSVTFLTGG